MVGLGMRAVALVVVAATALGAMAAPGPAVEPLGLLPADSTIFLRLRPLEPIQAQIQLTAAHKALTESGAGDLIAPVISRGIAELFARAGGNLAVDTHPKTAALVDKIFRQVWKHGFLAGIDTKLLIGEGVFILPAAGDSALAAELDEHLRLLASQNGLGVKEEEIQGRRIATIRMDPFLVSWWKEGSHFVLVGSMVGPHATLRRALGVEPGLSPAARPNLFKERAGYTVAGEFWLDVDHLVRVFPRVKAMPQILGMMGTDGLQGIAIAWGCDGPAIRTDVDLLMNLPRTGLLKSIDTPGMRASELPRLPPDVDSVSIFSFDGERLHDIVMPAAREAIMIDADVNGGPADPRLKTLENFLGANLKSELLAHLGHTGLLYSSPIDGIAGLAGMTLVLEIKDAAPVTAAIDKLANVIHGVEPASWVERHSTPEGTIWIGGYRGAAFPLTPTIGISKRWLVISPTSPAPVVRFLRTQTGEGPTWKMPPWMVERLAAADRTGVIALGHNDPRPTLRTLMSLSPLLMGMARNALPDLGINLTRGPDADKLLATLFPGSGIVTVDETGLHIVSHAALPLPGMSLDANGITTGLVLTALFGPLSKSLSVATPAATLAPLAAEGAALGSD